MILAWTLRRDFFWMYTSAETWPMWYSMIRYSKIALTWGQGCFEWVIPRRPGRSSFLLFRQSSFCWTFYLLSKLQFSYRRNIKLHRPATLCWRWLRELFVLSLITQNAYLRVQSVKTDRPSFSLHLLLHLSSVNPFLGRVQASPLSTLLPA